MPELPDVTIYVEALERRIVGKVLQRIRLADDLEVSHHCVLLYSCVAGERDGKLILDLDDEGAVRRHGGAYQQDILLYDEVDGGNVRQIPRVAIELKASGVTTHDAIVYAEKTRRLRTIYPYLRYLFVAVAAREKSLPRRLIRNGESFDAMLIVRPTPEGDGIKAEDLERLARVVEEEVSASRLFGDVWFGRRQGVLLRRRLDLT